MKLAFTFFIVSGLFLASIGHAELTSPAVDQNGDVAHYSFAGAQAYCKDVVGTRLPTAVELINDLNPRGIVTKSTRGASQIRPDGEKAFYYTKETYDPLVAETPEVAKLSYYTLWVSSTTMGANMLFVAKADKDDAYLGTFALNDPDLVQINSVVRCIAKTKK